MQYHSRDAKTVLDVCDPSGVCLTVYYQTNPLFNYLLKMKKYLKWQRNEMNMELFLYDNGTTLLTKFINHWYLANSNWRVIKLFK